MVAIRLAFRAGDARLVAGLNAPNSSPRSVAVVNLLLAGCALVLSDWSAMPWRGGAGFGLMSANLLGTWLAFRGHSATGWNWGLVAAWLLALILPIHFFAGVDRTLELENYTWRYATALAWLIAVAVVPLNSAILTPSLTARLRLPVLGGVCFTGALLVATAWTHNLSGAFHLGLVVGALVLIQCKLWFQLPAWAVQSANTLLLFALGLPVADFALRPHARGEVQPGNLPKFYGYTAARKDPVAFQRWWNYYAGEWQKFSSGLILLEPEGPRLRTNAQSTLIRCRITTNSRGFRGREIATGKGNAYRIVALGESTTFGITLNPTDRPWPEVLEDLIREQLKPNRPVEVINAGIPAITLPENVARLPADILPLKPDLIISYHGINGFHLLIPAMPSMRGESPPRYQPRPLKLLAEAEYAWRMRHYKRRLANQPVMEPPQTSDPMMTPYAAAYRQLIHLAATNRVGLVLTDYVMAVNRRSEGEAVEFYRVGYPSAPAAILANEAHSAMLDQLCREHPAVRRVDPRGELDGQYDNFIDLVHFTQPGRQKLAEIIFASLRPWLEQELNSAGR